MPQQDWAAYEARTAQSDANWIRGLAIKDRYDLYEDLFGIIWAARRGRGNWEQLDRWNWHQKFAIRLRSVEAFRKLDQIHRERTVANHSG